MILDNILTQQALFNKDFKTIFLIFFIKFNVSHELNLNLT